MNDTAKSESWLTRLIDYLLRHSRTFVQMRIELNEMRSMLARLELKEQVARGVAAHTHLPAEDGPVRKARTFTDFKARVEQKLAGEK